MSCLMDNIDSMAEKIQKSLKKNKDDAYYDLGLQKGTVSKWRTGKQLPRFTTVEDLLEKYDFLFEPPINDFNELLNNRLEEFILKADIISSSEYERFLGNYYVYYFSDHYEDEVHFGKLRISYNEKTQKCRVRMIIGFRNSTTLNNKKLKDVFSGSSDGNNLAYKAFKEYKRGLKKELDKRCYYYEGKLEATEMTITLKLNGSENREGHRQHIIFPIKRINRRLDVNTGKTKLYKGGVGLAIAYPNKEHRKLRIYRIGISRWPIDINNINVKQSLLHKTTDMNRVILSDDDDKKWYDTMLLYEAQSERP